MIDFFVKKIVLMKLNSIFKNSYSFNLNQEGVKERKHNIVMLSFPQDVSEDVLYLI